MKINSVIPMKLQSYIKYSFRITAKNKIVFIFGLLILLASCEFFEGNENKAIDICKKAKVQADLSSTTTWLDYANMLAKRDPDIKLDWTAIKTEDEGIYIVTFADEKGWGHNWEVNLDQQIVRYINGNEYLTRKYGLSRLDRDRKFIITDITINTLKLEDKYNYFSSDKSRDIVYILEGCVINKTDKYLIKAEMVGRLQVIFKEKTLESSEDMASGFKRKVTKADPWKPNEKLNFYLKTKDIEEIYLQYDPEYVFFNVNISVEDPVGFNYDKAIEEYNLKNNWKKLRELSTDLAH